MKQLFTFFFLLLGLAAFAQIPLTSPYPGEFRVTSPASVAGLYEVGKQSGWGDTLTQTVCGELEWAFDAGNFVYDTTTNLVDSSYTVITFDTAYVDVDTTVTLIDEMGQPYDSTYTITVEQITETETTETVQVTQTVITVVSFTSDSLMCNPGINDLTGKVALVRRGICNFSLKAYNAQQQGAVGVLIVNQPANDVIVNMAAGISAELVNIPAVLMKGIDANPITALVDNGETVSTCFYVPKFYHENGPFAYSVPVEEAEELNLIGVDYVNFSSVAESVTLNVAITEPNSNVVNLSGNFTANPGAITVLTLPATYKPTQLGDYNMKFTVNTSDDEINRKFVLSNDLYSQDDQEIDDFTAVSMEDYTNGSLRFDVGGFYTTEFVENAAPGTLRKATHASFALNNAKALHGSPFEIVLFNVDPDGSGAVETWGYDAFELLTFASVTLDSNVIQDQQLITIEFDDQPFLSDTGGYLLMIRFDGTVNPLDSVMVPQYSAAGNQYSRTVGNVVAVGGTISNGGWTTNERNVARLQISYISSANDKSLSKDQVQVVPNPVSNDLNLALKLDNIAASLQVQVSDASGRILSMTDFSQVQQNDTVTVDVSALAPGTYFATVVTQEGSRTKLFQVVR
jgi:hypothetical protein